MGCHCQDEIDKAISRERTLRVALIELVEAVELALASFPEDSPITAAIHGAMAGRTRNARIILGA